MPLHPKASLIADPARAAQLFPPQPCRKCSGTAKVQRYKAITCETCRGTAEIEQGGENGLVKVPCPECWNTAQKKSLGQRAVPETIPCDGCGGQGKKSRVHEARPATLGQAKPADWLVIGVEFPALPIEDLDDSKYIGASAELISCMIARVSPGRIIGRVLQSPEYSDSHGLKYGDLLELGPNHILVHTQCSQEEFEKARDGGLFNFAPVVPIPPVAGRTFITRGGTKATVWTSRNDQAGQFFIGQAGGRDLEWSVDGSHRQGQREFDLVQFTDVVNV
jgi:hypothetical protein